MLFSSPIYLAFFAAYMLAHFLAPTQLRLPIVIIGGTIFYAYWEPIYVWVPHALMLIAYAGTLWMDSADGERERQTRLTLTVVALLLPLAFFKYTNFVFRQITGEDTRILDLSLPLGISFVTFTLIAYVADVFRRHFRVERRLAMLAGYVIFFPHLIAGPILRPHELIPQLEKLKAFALRRVAPALAIFSVGLVKKLVFADPISNAIEPIFADPAAHSGLDALFAMYGFSLQIYCDFSGYTDMAIGSALLLGVHLPNNFARPYLARSITEFWHRWHITLSHWLRDYLYIPLGGNRRGFRRQLGAILITMLLGGLWHGANWTFVAWGALHGVAVSAAHALRRLAPGFRMPAWLAIILTFHFVTVAWVFFRAADFGRALDILNGLFTRSWGDVSAFASAQAFPLFLFVVFAFLCRWDDHRRIKIVARRLAAPVLWPVLAAMWALAITISTGSSAAFIYFEF
jgi:alginate O-acetyltransferase complex protein AlgI